MMQNLDTETSAEVRAQRFIAAGYWPSTAAYETLQQLGWDHNAALEKSQQIAQTADGVQDAVEKAMHEPMPCSARRFPTLQVSAERMMKWANPGDTIVLHVGKGGEISGVRIEHPRTD